MRHLLLPAFFHSQPHTIVDPTDPGSTQATVELADLPHRTRTQLTPAPPAPTAVLGAEKYSFLPIHSWDGTWHGEFRAGGLWVWDRHRSPASHHWINRSPPRLFSPSWLTPYPHQWPGKFSHWFSSPPIPLHWPNRPLHCPPHCSKLVL